MRYVIIVERGTRVAALQAGQVDAAFPGEISTSIWEQLRAAVPSMVFAKTASNVNENILINTKRPPFDDARVRRALSLAIDRRAYTASVHRGSAVVGASLSPSPWGVWGLLEKDLVRLPGYGKPADDKALARKLLGEAGYGPTNRLKVEMETRAIAIYLDFASFVVSALKEVGVEGKPGGRFGR